jgi:hypothetical protein
LSCYAKLDHTIRSRSSKIALSQFKPSHAITRRQLEAWVPGMKHAQLVQAPFATFLVLVSGLLNEISRNKVSLNLIAKL